MIKGVFLDNVPYIQIVLAWRAIQNAFFVLDTGFTGDLQLTPKLAKELGLRVAGITPVRIANGQIVEVPTALAVAAMEGATNYVEVLISDGMPLAGISFLSKFLYKAEIDCKYRTVILEKSL